MTYPTITAAASALRAAFETKTRDSGATFVTLRSSAEEWMIEAVRDAHGGMLPDDWRYAAIKAVAGSLYEDLDDDADEATAREASYAGCDALVDDYTASLTAWLASSVVRVAYCDTAAEEMGHSLAQDNALVRLLQLGQNEEYREIWDSLVTSLVAQVEEEGEEDEAGSITEGDAQTFADNLKSEA